MADTVLSEEITSKAFPLLKTCPMLGVRSEYPSGCAEVLSVLVFALVHKSLVKMVSVPLNSGTSTFPYQQFLILKPTSVSHCKCAK